MIRSTFCHLPGIGLKREERLWSCGIQTWDEFLALDRWPESDDDFFASISLESLQQRLAESVDELEKQNAFYFYRRLPPSEQWRLFRDFRDTVHYLDIETTGTRQSDTITSVALFDGKRIETFVQNRNLSSLPPILTACKTVVTYNGKAFDLPFLNRTFSLDYNPVHIDLRFIFAEMGFRGGLKGCEKALGLDRGELDGVNGYFAVLLWQEFLETGDESVLETLLAYNVEDTVNLETLMVIAFNRKSDALPFPVEPLPVPARPDLPFLPDRSVIDRVKLKL